MAELSKSSDREGEYTRMNSLISTEKQVPNKFNIIWAARRGVVGMKSDISMHAIASEVGIRVHINNVILLLILHSYNKY